MSTHHELTALVAQCGLAQAGTYFSGTFMDYYDTAKQNPEVVETAHRRLWRAIMRHGVDEVDTQSDARLNRLYGGGQKTLLRYRFFKDEFFGIDPVIMEVMEFLKAAAAGGEESRQILYFVGPVGTGKTSMVDWLKRALELSGPFYTLDGCPIQEEPLRLVPKNLREGIEQKLGLRKGSIKGWPCPLCQWRLRNEFDGDFTCFPVVQADYSVEREVGIGVLPPADENSMDVSLLIGQIDIGKVGKYAEADPRALVFNGALNHGERGITDLYEMNKNPTPLLHPLISASQEHKYRAPGQHPMLASDTVLLAHSNETELDNFRKDRRNEALIDRMVIVKFPYTLEKGEERRIVAKIVIRGADFRSDAGDPAHVAPGTIELIALFQVLSRVQSSEKVDLLTKVKLYDGEEIVERSAKSKPVDIRELREEVERPEGFEGLSTRFGCKVMGRALARAPSGVCVTPVHVMEVLAEEVRKSDEYNEERRTFLVDTVLKEHVRKWYLNEVLREHIGRGFLSAYKDAAQNMLDEYLDHVFAFVLHQRVRDRKTGEIENPSEEIMGPIETAIGVTETMRKEFRAQVTAFVGTVGERKEGANHLIIAWDTHPRLKEAIKNRMFESVKDFARVISRKAVRNPEDERRYGEMITTMKQELGYCPHCVDVVLQFAKNHNLFDPN